MENTSETTVRPSFEKASFDKTDNAPFDAPAFDEGPTVAPGPAPADPTLGTAPVPAPRSGFRLHRSRTDRMLGGVCGGLAESLGVDAALLRIGLIAITLLGAGIGVVLYLAAWLLVPERDDA